MEIEDRLNALNWVWLRPRGSRRF